VNVSIYSPTCHCIHYCMFLSGINFSRFLSDFIIHAPMGKKVILRICVVVLEPGRCLGDRKYDFMVLGSALPLLNHEGRGNLCYTRIVHLQTRVSTDKDQSSAPSTAGQWEKLSD